GPPATSSAIGTSPATGGSAGSTTSRLGLPHSVTRPLPTTKPLVSPCTTWLLPWPSPPTLASTSPVAPAMWYTVSSATLYVQCPAGRNWMAWRGSAAPVIAATTEATTATATTMAGPFARQ